VEYKQSRSPDRKKSQKFLLYFEVKK